MNVVERETLEECTKDLATGRFTIRYRDARDIGGDMLDAARGFVPPQKPILMIGGIPSIWLARLIDILSVENAGLRTTIDSLRKERSELRGELNRVMGVK